MSKAFILVEEGDCYSGCPNKNLFVFKTNEAAKAKLAELEAHEVSRREAHDELKKHCVMYPKQPETSYEDKKEQLAAKYNIEPKDMPDAHSSSWCSIVEYWIDEVEEQ